MTPAERAELTIEEYAVRVDLMRQRQQTSRPGGRRSGAWGELEDG